MNKLFLIFVAVVAVAVVFGFIVGEPILNYLFNLFGKASRPIGMVFTILITLFGIGITVWFISKWKK